MNILDFLELVVPAGGKKVAFVIPDSGRVSTKDFDTTEQLANAISQIDRPGAQVYYAVNGFGDYYTDEKTQKRKIRTQENVVACRSIYDDYDVDAEDPKKYDSKKLAVEDVLRLAKAVRLTPSVVDSGGGIHGYYHLDEDISPEQWLELSELKRSINQHLGALTDTSVDCDSARILRPVGSHNRKGGGSREVKLLKKGKTYTYEKVLSAMTSFIEENNVPRLSAATSSEPEIKNPFGAALEKDFPPSDAEVIASKCKIIGEFKESGGSIPEPQWHRAIGVVKHCTDGADKIHEWSSGDSSYSEYETNEKIAAWSLGPTSCNEMDRHFGCKESCPFAGKCKSPIQLGYSEDAPSKPTPHSAPPEPKTNKAPAGGQQQKLPPTLTVIENESIPHWPSKGYRWDGSALCRAQVDDEGVVHWMPFCKSLIYIKNRIKDAEGTWQILWRAREINGSWREFMMPTQELASADLMCKRFAANEVFLSRNKLSKGMMMEFAEGLVETLQKYRVETQTHNNFGWTKDKKGFILGSTMLTRGKEIKILCSDEVPQDIACDFERSGTLDEWVENVDKLYNRPGAEPFQFAVCHAMGSVLVDVMGSSNWHGLPLAFTGHGGTGKSTACKIACGFYGNPKFMERQTGEQGSTLNAAIKRIAVMGSVPVILDEFSGRSPEELTRTGYALANGRDKERLGASGRFSNVGTEWFKNSFITSNDSIHESIAQLPNGFKVDATQLRFFEVHLPPNYRMKVFSDITQEFIEHHLNNVYGEACRPFIKFVIKNRPWVKKQLERARAKFNPKSEDENKERFYRDTIVTALVAGKIAEKLGLIKFDLKNTQKWAVNSVVKMRQSRQAHNVDMSEHVSRYLMSLTGRLIITRKFGDGRSVAETSMEIIRGHPMGRVCTEDKKMYITVASLTEYARDNHIPQRELKEELDRLGYLIIQADGKPSRRVSIGAGSNVPSGQSHCYEFHYDKVYKNTANLSMITTKEFNSVSTSAT